MKNEKIVTINGKLYEASTGKPVEHPKISALSSRRHHPGELKPHAHTMHHIYNRTVKKPIDGTVSVARTVSRVAVTASSQSIARFSKPISGHTAAASNHQTEHKAPFKHPIAHRAVKRIDSIKAATKLTPKSSLKETKEAVIKQALEAAPQEKPIKVRFFKKYKRIFNRFSIGAVALLASLILVYIYLPVLSVNVASYQAGIEATYPTYTPDGYSFSGPVSYTSGQVVINFRSNSGGGSYTISEAKSNWDSSALGEKVSKDTKGEFISTAVKGLTIYTHQDGAQWVNKQILYSIDSDAKLSRDQLIRIATSL